MKKLHELKPGIKFKTKVRIAGVAGEFSVTGRFIKMDGMFADVELNGFDAEMQLLGTTEVEIDQAIVLNNLSPMLRL